MYKVVLRGKAELLRRIACHHPVTDFGALDIQSTNTCLDLPFRAKSMANDPLAAIVQPFVRKAGHKCISFGFQRFRQHPERAFPCKFSQRNYNSF